MGKQLHMQLANMGWASLEQKYLMVANGMQLLI